MKSSLVSLLFLLSFPVLAADIYQFELNQTDDTKFKFSSLKGRPFMLVNIATRCGFTPQLEELEKVYQQYKGKGLEVVGIPSNDFNEQTPEANKEVAAFCKATYGVSFPITQKIVVRGKNRHELFNYVSSQNDNRDIAWNFEKFVFDKAGKLVGRFSSSTKPLSKDVTGAIEKAVKSL